MNEATFVLMLHLLAGTAILFLGRRLFWLFVAAAGFLASFEIVPQLMPGRSEGFTLLVAVVAGGLGALLAVGLQYVAAAIVGFVAGSYVTVPIAVLLFGQSAAWISLAGGAVGALLMVLFFDWALIALSAAAGARAVLLPFGLEGPVGVVAWLVLAAVGIAFQASRLQPARLQGRPETPRA